LDSHLIERVNADVLTIKFEIPETLRLRECGAMSDDQSDMGFGSGSEAMASLGRRIFALFWEWIMSAQMNQKGSVGARADSFEWVPGDASRLLLDG
jgi:hypothetical protein